MEPQPTYYKHLHFKIPQQKHQFTTSILMLATLFLGEEQNY